VSLRSYSSFDKQHSQVEDPNVANLVQNDKNNKKDGGDDFIDLRNEYDLRKYNKNAQRRDINGDVVKPSMTVLSSSSTVPTNVFRTSLGGSVI